MAVLFVAGEVTGRLLERYTSYMPARRAAFVAPNPFLRTALVPGARSRSGTFEVEVNALGFRGDEISASKKPGTFRIFALGESSTFGWKGASTHHQAWPALLEGKLRAAHPGRTIEVVNAGVPGWNSVQQRINFMLRISALEPDAIVVYHGNNDLQWSWMPDVETKTVYATKMSRDRHNWRNRLLEHSYVFMEIRKRLLYLDRVRLPKHDEPDAAALRMVRRHLEGLIRDAKALDVEVAIGTFAHGFDEAGAPGEFSADERALGVPGSNRFFLRLSHQGVRRSFPIYNAMVRDLAAAEGIPLCELAGAIPKTPEYFVDWCHLTAKGEEAMATRWFETIEAAGWLDAPS